MSPSSMRSSVVLPAPFGPMRPMRSPRITRVEKSRTTTRSPNAFPICSASKTSLPDDSACSSDILTLPAWLRRAARSARISIRRLTRPSSRVRRALTPRRSHTSSSARRLSNLSLARFSLASHSSFFCRKVCVVAGPRRQVAAIEFEHARGQAFEEGAVVGDEQHGPGVVAQERLQPLDGLDVEVVGGLVEQQHVGRGHQRAGQQHAPPPAAGQRVDRRVGGQVEAGEHHLDALFERPAVALLELVLEAPHLVERLEAAVRHLGRRVVIRGHQRGQVAEALRHHVEDRVVRVERHVLHQPRHLHAGVAPHHAAIGRQLAAHDLHQRGLAGAVAADEGKPFARLDLERHVVEQGQVAVGVGDMVEGQ